MSLINQMLQDLEKRGENQDSHAAAHYEQFGSVIEQSKLRKTSWWLLMFVSIVLVAVIFFVFKTRLPVTAAVATPEKLPTVSKDASPPVNSTKPVDSITSGVKSDRALDNTPDTAPALHELGLSLKLSTQVNAAGLNELAVRMEQSEQNARARDKSDISLQPEINNKQNKDVTGTAIRDKPKSEKLSEKESIPTNIANSSGNVSVGKNTALASPSAVVATVNSAPVNSASVTMIKEVSTQQRAEGEYRQATVYQQQGRVNEALSVLESALKADPLHAPARQLLISLLLENKRYEEAIRELRQGLVVEPTQLNFSMILARLLVERAKLPDAIDVLQKNINLAQDRPDYLAFLAALQQKSGHHKDAISLYRQALRNHSQNGAWWMGLGISLQAEANSQEAIEAYKQAKQQPGLSAELHAFIDQKISQLQK
ncbi:tetratricopeptide repeat protein [Undibacterium flavidum]|uniref:Tetratricopeptide repeat protein n=1 Tax=Undibacterium flavidum TaxID=2762297 RepID=A0ABR6YFI2_9BURK|nr:tetratricopeptide repeat protein [Undibacterium flavidum]MBC3875267.1 tetratricopeptide repeat protein [Undibacterium flavidum]